MIWLIDQWDKGPKDSFSVKWCCLTSTEHPLMETRLELLLSNHCLGLTHWGRVTHICVGKLTNIGSDNGLSPGRRQAIIWTNAGILLTQTLGINFSEIFSKIHTFSFKKMYLKMSSGKRRPFCLSLNVLSHETMVCAVCLVMFFRLYHCILYYRMSSNIVHILKKNLDNR